MYNDNYSLTNVSTAGKITVVTTLLGVLVFAFIFLFNIGKQEFQQAVAQSNATTSVTVLNTPPQWTVNAYETTASATTTPTNSGSVITWSATAVDSNSEPYRLLICSNTATPTPGTSTTTPTCGTGAIQWAVSATTSSGVAANAATTTSEAFPPFAERNNWYAWVCDSIDLNARCNATYTGVSAFATGTPFHVNRRPTFTAFWDNSPADPGATVTFTATSSDQDTVGGNDTVKLWVCSTSSYNATTNSCGPNGTLASSTFATGNRTAQYTIVIPTQDANFTAYGYIVDEHGHEASGGSQGSNSTLTVNNVAPTVSAASIDINNGQSMILTNAATQTPGFILEFTTTDNNSCLTSLSGEEVTNYALSLYRSGVGSTTCDALTGTEDYNNCYISTDTNWNLNCVATTTVANDCNFANDSIDTTRQWYCTFPLWFIADPTDATSTVYSAQDWRAEVRAVDDDNATGTPNESSIGRDVWSLLAFALNTVAIPYGELEPGDDTGTLSASTTASATGNVGIDQTYNGQSMCDGYDGITPCPVSATSTIPVGRQEFGTSTIAYGTGINLTSTTTQELEINIKKSTTTSNLTLSTGRTYWGIEVPATITLAGLYTGENTFYAVVAEGADWY